MADSAVSGAELKKLLTLAKKKPLAFAYCFGSKSEGDIFVLHHMKTPETLGRLAKAEGETGNHSFGMAHVDGKIISLTCERKLPKLAKRLKLFLRNEKRPMTVRVLDMDGTVIEEENEELLDDVDAEAVEVTAPDTSVADAADAEPDTQDQGHALAKKLHERAAAIKAEIVDAPQDVQPGLIKMFKVAIGALQASKFEDAAKILTELEARLRKPARDDDGKDAPNIKVLRQISATLKTHSAALSDAGLKDRIAPVLARLDAEIDAGNVENAKKTAAALKAALAKVALPASDAAVVGQAFQNWQATLVSAQDALGNLHKALMRVGSDAVTRISNKALDVTGLGDPAALNSAIDAYNKAGSDGRVQAGSMVSAEVETFRSALSSNRVIDILEANPFGVDVKLRAPLQAALNRIQTSVNA